MARAEGRRRGAEGYFGADDLARAWLRQRGECFYCGGRLGRTLAEGEHEADHITPVSKGGTNHPRNIALSCRPCNRSKHGSYLVEFKRRRAEEGRPIRF